MTQDFEDSVPDEFELDDEYCEGCGEVVPMFYRYCPSCGDPVDH